MLDRNAFMETLHTVQEIARVSPEPMDRKTALGYFSEMELNSEQEEMVYQFLMLPPEEEQPQDNETEEAPEADDELQDAKEGQEKAKEQETGPRFELYLQEIQELSPLEKEKERQLYEKLSQGDTSVIEAISRQWLKQVISIAKSCQRQGYLLDDLVQEGNIGLLMALQELAGKAVPKDVEDVLTDSIRKAIEDYIQMEAEEEQQEEAILGRLALIQAAQEFLTKEKGQQPSIRELSDYTRIPVDEITDMLSLMKEKK